MTGAALLFHQFRFDQRMFWRNVPAVFFAVVLPLLFLVIFATIFGGNTNDAGVPLDAYYVPTIISLGVISATFVNIAIGVTIQREEGVLKRLRGTPLPTGVFVAGRVAGSIVNAYLIAAAIALAGWLFYGVEISVARVLGLLIVCGIGGAAFCCLGFALTAAIPNQDSAPPIANAIVLPLYFISGIFFADEMPAWLNAVAEIFPVKHLAEAMLGVYGDNGGGLGIDWVDIAVVAAWGIVGLALAMRYFRWTPSAR